MQVTVETIFRLHGEAQVELALLREENKRLGVEIARLKEAEAERVAASNGKVPVRT